MINIHKKTLQDLEFSTVLEQMSEHCVTTLGHTSALCIITFKNKDTLRNALKLTNEYLFSFYKDNHIPIQEFEPMNGELKLRAEKC